MRKIIFVCTTLCLMHCSDVIIPNISEDLVLLRTPQDGAQIVGNTVNLSWEGLPDAIDYRLEVATPDFANIQQLVVDTITTALGLELPLSTGVYEWRITAFNEAYASACCEERSFQMLSDEDADLSNLSLILQTPQDNALSNGEEVMCSWLEIEAASAYRFQLSTVSNFASLLVDELVSENAYLLTNLEEQDYYWRVRGESEVSNTFTSYSDRKFTIDQTVPPSPVLVFPDDEAVWDPAAQEIDFSWLSGGESEEDTLYIYEDVFLDQLLWKQATDQQNVAIDTMSLILETGDYYWNVRSVDAAQNVSEASESRKFTVE